jgi:hypothetical protein
VNIFKSLNLIYIYIVSSKDYISGKVSQSVIPKNIEEFKKHICYFGDHVEEDIMNSKRSGWKSIWVAPEVLDVGIKASSSSNWASFYPNKSDLFSSKNLLVHKAESNALMVVPSIEWFAKTLSHSKSWTVSYRYKCCVCLIASAYAYDSVMIKHI